MHLLKGVDILEKQKILDDFKQYLNSIPTDKLVADLSEYGIKIENTDTSEQENITLYKDNVNTKYQLTFQELYDELQDEIKDYTLSGQLDELMSQKIKVYITDLEGQVLEGYLTGVIGWLEDGEVLLTANLRDIFFKKERCHD